MFNICKIFHSIQGEGPFVGKPAVFIRFSGCNLKCPFCDTKQHTNGFSMSPEEILEAVNMLKGKSKLCVLTGGEPFLRTAKLEPLVLELFRLFPDVQVETNGTIMPLFTTGTLEKLFIVCSPKEQQAVSTRLKPFIDAYKILVDNNSVHHLEFLSMYEADGIPILLQPLDVGERTINQKNLRATINLCIKKGHRLSLQLHKLLGVQ